MKVKRIIFGLFVLGFIIALAGVILGDASEQATTNDALTEESETLDINSPDIIFDVNLISLASYERVKEVLGEPEKTDEWVYESPSGNKYNAITWTYDAGNQEVIFMDNQAVRYTLYGEGQSYQSHEEALRLFNIIPEPSMIKTADTGAAFRYANVSGTVDDFWMIEENGGTIGILKITFDSSYFK